MEDCRKDGVGTIDVEDHNPGSTFKLGHGLCGVPDAVFNSTSDGFVIAPRAGAGRKWPLWLF